MKYIYSILSSIMFTLFPFFMKQLMEKGIQINTLNFYYVFVSLVAFFIISVIRNKGFKQFKINKTDAFLAIFSVGFIGFFLNNLCMSYALKYIDVSLISFIRSSFPIIVVIAQVLFFKYKVTKKNIMDLFLVISGYLLILGKVSPQKALLVGVIITFGCSMSIAYYSLALEKIPTKLDDFTFWFYCQVGSIVPFFISYLLSNETGIISSVFSDFNLFLYMVITALGSYTFAGFFYGIGVRKIGAIKSGILEALSKVFAVLLDIVLYGVSMNVYQFIGMLLVILTAFTDLIFKADK